jgi:hypothetical protein
MTNTCELPAGMMATATCFHSDQTSWCVHQKLHELRTRKASLKYDVPALVHAYEVEDSLAEVNADRLYVHEEKLLGLRIQRRTISLRTELVDRRADAGISDGEICPDTA